MPQYLLDEILRMHLLHHLVHAAIHLHRAHLAVIHAGHIHSRHVHLVRILGWVGLGGGLLRLTAQS